jgi:acetyltransferase-like isoleucine patch superfamily enzyme
MIAKTVVIFPNVELGKDVIIEDFCIIGSPSKVSKKEKTIIGDNAIIRSHTVIYAGNKIGNNFQTGNKVNIRELNEIGENVSIGSHSVVEHHVKIKDNVRIHSSVFIPEFTILEKDCWIGPGVFMTNAKYPKSANVKNELKGVRVGENAKIGANVTILPAVIIGSGSLIGAGSVITKDVKRSSIYAGNPARFLRKVHY